jgi:titin
LSANAVSKSQINLQWADRSDNETGFEIERSTDNVRFSRIKTVNANVTTYINTNLTAGKTYWYRVNAKNGVGDSTYSNTASATTPLQ